LVSGVIEGGSGEWNLTAANWVTPNFPLGDINTTYRRANRLIFGGAPGTVNVTADIPQLLAPSGIHFATGGYTFNLAPGCDLYVDGGITSSQAPQPLFTLDGGSQTMTVAGALDAAGQSVVVNSGTLLLDITSRFTNLGSVDLRGGTLRLAMRFWSPDGYDRLPLRFSGNVSLILGGPFGANGASARLTGGMTIAAGTVLTLANDLNTTLYSNSTIIMEGDATLNLNTSSTQEVHSRLTPQGSHSIELGGNTLSISGRGSLSIGSGSGDFGTVDRIRGTGKIVISGEPVVYFSDKSTFNGGVELNSGRLIIGSNFSGIAGSPTSGPIGTGTLTIAGGSIEATRNLSFPYALGNSVEVLGDFTFGSATFGATFGNQINFAGPVNLGAATRTITVFYPLIPGNSISGSIGGAVGTGLTKAGPGQLNFTGSAPNTYSGTTTVSDGMLRLEKTTENSSIPGDLIVGDGTPFSSSAIVRLQLGAVEQIANDARATMNGGRLELWAPRETAGVLAMQSNSTLGFSQSGAPAVASFSSFENPDGRILRIENWNGSLSGGGSTQLRIASFDPSLLPSFEFVNYPPGAAAIDFGSYIEVVPAVPEPGVLGFAAGAVLGLFFRCRMAASCRERKQCSAL
jgi:autotransporter-associated beta strand protein